MYLCYIDESGTSAIPGNTSHFVLAGVSLPIWHWRDADRDIRSIKRAYGLENAEIHTAWILRSYREQSQIDGFETLTRMQRRSEVHRARTTRLLNLQKSKNKKTYRQTKKNFLKTDAYTHLTRQERIDFIEKIAECISRWGFTRLFAECIDKTHFDPARTFASIDEQTFEQIVSRFETYLQKTDDTQGQRNFGLIVHDNNQTVARKHTLLMRDFHRKGTLWTNVERIIETPLFVDSQLTSMVQIADLCAYALRRFLENNENRLFDHIFARADRYQNRVVGVRHYTDAACQCTICLAH